MTEVASYTCWSGVSAALHTTCPAPIWRWSLISFGLFVKPE